MPYIDQEKREVIDFHLKDLITHWVLRRTFVKSEMDLKGELTYIFYKIAVDILKQEDISYNRLSMITSCLNDAKVEFERRKIASYEDLKIKENGDIL